MPMRLLVIGFSVTEMPSSYIPILKQITATREPDLEIDYCGTGGLTIEDLCYLLNNILDTRPRTTHVIFEISTGNGRHEEFNAALQRDPSFMAVLRSRIDSLIQSCSARGIGCGFIGFPRRDFDTHTDYVDRLIQELCEVHDRPFLRVGCELARAGIALDTILSDVVHPVPQAARQYAERMLELIGLLRAQPLPFRSRSDVIRYSAYSLTAHGTVSRFIRHGFIGDYIELLGGQFLHIKLPRPMYIRGLAALAGPRGGLVTIQSADFHQHLFYDEYCYYERLMTVRANIGRTDELTISLSRDMPHIKLLKGERNIDQRRVGLFSLFRDEHGEGNH